jgi:hypothetical protein
MSFQYGVTPALRATNRVFGEVADELGIPRDNTIRRFFGSAFDTGDFTTAPYPETTPGPAARVIVSGINNTVGRAAEAVEDTVNGINNTVGRAVSAVNDTIVTPLGNFTRSTAETASGVRQAAVDSAAAANTAANRATSALNKGVKGGIRGAAAEADRLVSNPRPTPVMDNVFGMNESRSNVTRPFAPVESEPTPELDEPPPLTSDVDDEIYHDADEDLYFDAEDTIDPVEPTPPVYEPEPVPIDPFSDVAPEVTAARGSTIVRSSGALELENTVMNATARGERATARATATALKRLNAATTTAVKGLDAAAASVSGIAEGVGVAGNVALLGLAGYESSQIELAHQQLLITDKERAHEEGQNWSGVLGGVLGGLWLGTQVALACGGPIRASVCLGAAVGGGIGGGILGKMAGTTAADLLLPSDVGPEAEKELAGLRRLRHDTVGTIAERNTYEYAFVYRRLMGLDMRQELTEKQLDEAQARFALAYYLQHQESDPNMTTYDKALWTMGERLVQDLATTGIKVKNVGFDLGDQYGLFYERVHEETIADKIKVEKEIEVEKVKDHVAPSMHSIAPTDKYHYIADRRQDFLDHWNMDPSTIREQYYPTDKYRHIYADRIKDLNEHWHMDPSLYNQSTRTGGKHLDEEPLLNETIDLLNKFGNKTTSTETKRETYTKGDITGFDFSSTAPENSSAPEKNDFREIKKQYEGPASSTVVPMLGPVLPAMVEGVVPTRAETPATTTAGVVPESDQPIHAGNPMTDITDYNIDLVKMVPSGPKDRTGFSAWNPDFIEANSGYSFQQERKPEPVYQGMFTNAMYAVGAALLVSALKG